MTTSTTITRPIMTARELANHRIGSHGRDYSQSDDGWSDMEVASRAKWRAVSGWGRDGWDLGDWPYVVISEREHDSRRCDPICVHAGDTGSDFCRRYEMRQTVEGDTDVYAFDTEADRNAAIDYLFVWYGIGRDYDEWQVAGLTSREALDAGSLRVPAEFRGPFSWARLDAEKAAQVMPTFCVTMYVDVEADSLEAAYDVANGLLADLASDPRGRPLGHVEYSDITEVEDFDDALDPDWPRFGWSDLCEEDPDREGWCAYHGEDHEMAGRS